MKPVKRYGNPKIAHVMGLKFKEIIFDFDCSLHPQFDEIFLYIEKKNYTPWLTLSFGRKNTFFSKEHLKNLFILIEFLQKKEKENEN